MKYIRTMLKKCLCFFKITINKELELITWPGVNITSIYASSARPHLLHTLLMMVGQRILMQRSSSYSPSAPSLSSSAMDFPTLHTISQRHASAVSKEGGRLFVVLPAEPHMAACINQREHTPEKCSFAQFEHIFIHELKALRSSVVQMESPGEVD